MSASTAELWEREELSPPGWMQLLPQEQDAIARTIADRWLQRGFPHYNLSPLERFQEFSALQRYDRSRLIGDGVVGQTLHAMGLAWHYFPHHWEVRVGKMKTAWDVWNSYELLTKAIKSRIKWGGFITDADGVPDLSAASMRKALRTYSGVQRVSNFRPSAAAAIYDRYCPDAGTVWDMSSGYGGRLLGAIASRRVHHYVGTDPASLTMSGLRTLAGDFAHLTQTCVTLHQQGSEEFSPAPGSIDLCFTSPPYFNTEEYAYDLGQSAVRYDTVSSWNNGFMRATIRNCRRGLKDGGVLILNVADVKTHKTLVSDTLQAATDEGFVLVETLQLALSSITKGGYKYEPVMVFK